jgi:hypothetical protein
MTTAKDRSTHSESSIFQVSSVLNICLKNDYACHNDGKDGDQNTDSLFIIIIERIVLNKN